MKCRTLTALLTVAFALALPPGTAVAHITPPVVLVSDRDAVVSLLGGAQKFFVRELRLTAEEAAAIQKESGWRPEDDFYRFYIGRDEAGRLVASVIFMTEFTIHGPIRVAVGIGPDGKVIGASVVEMTEETYPWVKPLIDTQFTRQYVGRGRRDTFAPTQPAASARAEPMTQFYGQVVASLIQRALVLYEVAVRHGLK